MNYNFKENWESVIVPHLRTKIIRDSIKKTIESYIQTALKPNGESVYKSSLPPASWSSGDSWYCILENFERTKLIELIKLGVIRDISETEKRDRKLYNEYYKYVNKSMKPYVKHFKTYSMESHQVFGTCHWLNPIFGLTLARLICPMDNWVIISGINHTTIVNVDRSKVFDILRFYENDSDLGGKIAINDSLQTKRRLYRMSNKGKSLSESDNESVNETTDKVVLKLRVK